MEFGFALCPSNETQLRAHTVRHARTKPSAEPHLRAA